MRSIDGMDGAFIAAFRDTVDTAAARLLELSNERAAVRPAVDKWSPKEIIGHLIDSASNNHGGYEQAEWVAIQRYQEREWADLVRLWQAFNHHIAHVMETAEAEALARIRVRHNLDVLALRPPQPGQPATLEYFMRDYVDHLKHHLRQALGA
jgi:hypothetical protein